MTSIEWTDKTLNVVTGCTKVSPGCDNCYAETFAERFRGVAGHHFETGFDLTLRPNALTLPLRWKKPRRIFVNSMSDLFHKDIPGDYIARLFAVMALTPQHTYQVLTKRHGRMRSLLGGRCDCGHSHGPGMHFRSAMAWAVSKANPDRVPGVPDDAEKRVFHDTPWPLPNVWMGVSVEDQQRADLRIPALLDTPAAVRFLSCEPLLGPVKLPFFEESKDCTCGGYGPPYYMHEAGCGLTPGPAWGALHWVIVGGESGHRARPMHPDWARSLRDQCQQAGVPYLFKQHGEWVAAPSSYGPDVPDRARASTRLLFAGPGDVDGQIMLRAGKGRAGRVLDGRTWDEFPAVHPAAVLTT
ncbi:phage Gp37/Gp68 family protein [Streptomyces sp. 549]|uniref:DUF5131 family protein n=1 Tax=Streptomyces sp. 549 TaxID=3049076 RepID=UPI0024C30273|nr:phage Gp37/Gp68 family protein [Streptomyces sp. 549]MDK1473679.1 phage Gp37/Gp68 family protein [Streptomyces sp. 549]